MQVTTIGLDLAKNVFQVHGDDARGNIIVRRALRRREVLVFFGRLAPCLVGMEACATAHYWAREIARFGHEVRLMPPAYVKPYVNRNKNDRADAEAICEAVRRPTMRFVAVKTAQQQLVLMLHRTQALLVRQRTMLANAIRAHLAEFGFIAAKSFGNLLELIERLTMQPAQEEPFPDLVRIALAPLVTALVELEGRVKKLEVELVKWHRTNETSRLATIPA